MAVGLADLTMDEYMQQRHEYGSFFPDPNYGHAQLGPLAMEFVDTAPVQRLRGLKQLGCASYAFPTAEHSRFVHSIGVGHLAEQCALHLGATGVRLKPLHVELLGVAGLCHDLGHGPFSHVFEGEFLPAVSGGRHNWNHEAMSAQLIQYIVDEYNIDIDQECVKRIQDIISSGGKLPQQLVYDSEDAWQLQIVANAVNGIDVDKIDYLQRDARMTRPNCRYDFSYLMTHYCRVINGNICFPYTVDDLPQVAAIYQARADMHRLVYQHRTSKAAEYMIVDALKAADPVLGISDKIHSPEEFILLDDSLVREIERAAHRDPAEPRLQEAAAILKRLTQRDFYKFVAEAAVPQKALEKYEAVTPSYVVSYQDHNCGVMLHPDDILVHNMKIDFCKEHEDPLKHVTLFKSDGSLISAADAAGSLHWPTAFVCRKVRVFLRKHCPDLVQQQQYMAAVHTAFTRAMQQRFGSSVQIQISTGSKSSSQCAAAKQQQQQQCLPMLLLQQLDHAGSGNSSSSVLGQHVVMQDVGLPLRTEIVQQWTLQQQQKGLAAVHQDPDLGEYVPATDDEADDVIPDNVTVADDCYADEDMTGTQFSTQISTQFNIQPEAVAAAVAMQQ